MVHPRASSGKKLALNHKAPMIWGATKSMSKEKKSSILSIRFFFSDWRRSVSMQITPHLHNLCNKLNKINKKSTNHPNQ